MTGTDRGTEESRKVPLKKKKRSVFHRHKQRRRAEKKGGRKKEKGEGEKASKTLNEAHTLFVRVPRNETK